MPVDTLQAKPQGQGWWYSNRLIKNINLMFLDLNSYKQKVSWSDSIITTQDTLIVRQEKAIESQKKTVELARSSEYQANFRADFYEKFAKEQQTITLKTLQKQNKLFLIIGASVGVLITLLITK